VARPDLLSLQRPLRRWAGAALAAALLVLTLAALWGNWSQYTIMQSVSAESARTDAYQIAAYLSMRQEALVQGVLSEPDGEEREAVADVTDELRAAVQNLVAIDPDQGARNARIVQDMTALERVTATYVAALDRGDEVAAQQILEDDLELVCEQIRADLLTARDVQLTEYAASLDRAERDSGLLVLGTALTMLLSVGFLTVLGLRERTHRRAIERMAIHDALTGLPNRTAFQERTERALAAARADCGTATVLMLDLDGFKEVNDNFGHHAGDALLVQVAHRLRRAVRGGDTVSRLGGDEFAVLLAGADAELGEVVAERITESFNEPFVVDGIALDIEVSIGIVTTGGEADTATVMQSADTAMYAAKQHRLGFTRFDPEQAHQTASRLSLLGDLRRALDTDGEIELHYQPKIAIDTGAVIGAEALARWRHPVRGVVAPFDFIPVLEGTSLIHRFTARVLHLALTQARQWIDEGHRIPVAVNVSTRCLLDVSFPDTVTKALNQTGLPGDMLCIEITESTVMANPELAISVLRRIRELGVRTAIDDFGTGYSSMAYLKILPVDEIKVDRSFVKDMAVDHNNYVLVESTVDLGHNLGLAVVAEGVEDEPTVAALQDLGCDTAQGYHYAKPLPAEHFNDYLARQSVPR
jgi:diguanylate cyclase (GGDEF)-like protein